MGEIRGLVDLPALDAIADVWEAHIGERFEPEQAPRFDPILYPYPISWPNSNPTQLWVQGFDGGQES